MSVRTEPRYACVEDVDEVSGDVIEELENTHNQSPAPQKETNTSKARKESRRERRGSISPVQSGGRPTPTRQRIQSPARRSRDRSRPGEGKIIVHHPKSRRHYAAATRNTPKPSPSASLVLLWRLPATVTTSVPALVARTMRPASYYATSRATVQCQMVFATAGAGTITYLIPPQPWAAPQTLGYPAAQLAVQQDYFSRPLEHRFGRPQSAMGFQAARSNYDDYEQENERPAVERAPRRTSLHKKLFKPDDDARAMPPPPRPATTRPTSSAPSAPHPPHQRGGHWSSMLTIWAAILICSGISRHSNRTSTAALHSLAAGLGGQVSALRRLRTKPASPTTPRLPVAPVAPVVAVLTCHPPGMRTRCGKPPHTKMMSAALRYRLLQRPFAKPTRRTARAAGPPGAPTAWTRVTTGNLRRPGQRGRAMRRTSPQSAPRVTSSSRSGMRRCDAKMEQRFPSRA